MVSQLNDSLYLRILEYLIYLNTCLMLNLEIMQKIVFKAFLLSMMIAFVSCDNEEDNSGPFFQIDATSVNVRESGIFNREIPLSTNITKFEITVDPTTGKDESGEYWCTAEVKNNLLVITCKENTIYDPRETDLVLKPEGMQAVKIHVFQLGQAPIILPSQTDFPLSFLEETINLDIVSNVDYEIVIPEWIKKVPSTKAPETVSTSYQFTVELNEDPKERIDTIYINQKDVEEAKAKVAKVVVKQRPNMPSPVVNAKAQSMVSDAAQASITISWDAFPAEDYVKEIEVSYQNPGRTKAGNEVIVEKLPADATSYTIENTFKKYGEYEFSVKAINIYDNAGEPIIIKITSERVPHVPGAVTGETKLNLANQEASSNAQEPNEGPLVNLFDGSTGNFFHSQWSGTPPAAPHWIQVKLPKTLSDHFKIKTTPRNDKNIPVDIDLYGSKNGKDWFLIKNITKGGENAPWTSDVIRIMTTFSYLKYSVNKTNSGTVYWSMAELEVYDVTTEIVSDPEEE